MMQPRCAVCDRDNDIQTLCDAHAWLTHVYALVYTGGWSDWPLPPIGPLVSQRHMLTSNAIADDRAKSERPRPTRPGAPAAAGAEKSACACSL